MKASVIFGTGVNKRNQARLAAAAGVSETTMSRWHRNPDSIPAGKLELLIKACGLSDNELLELYGRRKRK